jgi:hypothetical protein
MGMSLLRVKNTASRVEQLNGVVRQIRGLPPGRPVGKLLLARLAFAWGNFGYSASIRYLQQVERLFRERNGAVLECGSGATTLLLALLAEKYDRYVWTFENHEDWGVHIRKVLSDFDLDRLTVCFAPLCGYGDYEWYQFPQMPLPRDFGLVVCDGPPGKIRGGRYGLLPVMGGYLRPDCRILLDDTHRRREQELIARWAEEWRLTWNPLGATGSCAEIAFA